MTILEVDAATREDLHAYMEMFCAAAPELRYRSKDMGDSHWLVDIDVAAGQLRDGLASAGRWKRATRPLGRVVAP